MLTCDFSRRDSASRPAASVPERLAATFPARSTYPRAASPVAPVWAASGALRRSLGDRWAATGLGGRRVARMLGASLVAVAQPG